MKAVCISVFGGSPVVRVVLVQSAMAIMAFSPGITASAQPAAIELCREAPSDAARIACLEEALAAQAGAESATGEEAPGQAGEGPPEPASGPPAASVASSAADAATNAAAGRDAAHAERPPSQPTPVSPPQRMGAEQVRRRNETSAEAAARLASVSGLEVTRYSEVPYQRLQVELENGQVWRQIPGDTQHIRADLKRNRTVDIEESPIGGYKLRLNEMRRTIRVERIR